MAAMPTEVRAGRRRPLGMAPSRFLRDYWQKRPLLVRGAFPDFASPVAPDDLAGLACEELALSRIVIEDVDASTPTPAGPRRRGQPGAVAASRWTVRNGPFAETDFARLPSSHWTLLVQDVDKWDADAAALLESFRFLPSWRIDDVMVSYAEDGGSVGAHVDQYDVFLLQGLGRRRWQIDARCGPNAEFAFRDDTELKLLRTFAPTAGWVLEPGDMLYLPPGVPHLGVALGACMTYSIGMRAPSSAELLVDFAETLAASLPDTLRLSDPDLAPVRGDGEIDAAAIGRVARAMPWLRWTEDGRRASSPRAAHRFPGFGAVDSRLLRAWFGRFITAYRSAQLAAPPPRRLGETAFARLFEPGARVRRNPWSRVAWMREDGGALLFVAGEAHACSVRLARQLGTHDEFEPGGRLAHRDRALLRTLVDAGHYVAVDARRRTR
jgi:50S ribosomal protein L16 3-hydroxylase